MRSRLGKKKGRAINNRENLRRQGLSVLAELFFSAPFCSFSQLPAVEALTQPYCDLGLRKSPWML
jgi:hypothetical protein